MGFMGLCPTGPLKVQQTPPPPPCFPPWGKGAQPPAAGEHGGACCRWGGCSQGSNSSGGGASANAGQALCGSAVGDAAPQPLHPLLQDPPPPDPGWQCCIPWPPHHVITSRTSCCNAILTSSCSMRFVYGSPLVFTTFTSVHASTVSAGAAMCVVTL